MYLFGSKRYPLFTNCMDAKSQNLMGQDAHRGEHESAQDSIKTCSIGVPVMWLKETIDDGHICMAGLGCKLPKVVLFNLSRAYS